MDKKLESLRLNKNMGHSEYCNDTHFATVYRRKRQHTEMDVDVDQVESVPQVDTMNDRGTRIAEGKTKVIYAIPGSEQVLIVSKDRITAFNAERQHEVEGKARLSNVTTCLVFQYLNSLGIRTHFIKADGDSSFIALRCVMIPIEWVARRVATGSFLKRNPQVHEGYRFSPPKIELFYKDDANGDPQWSTETLIESGLTVSGVSIGEREVKLMIEVTRAVFEILERSWNSVGCSLIDMKIEFGVHVVSGNIILADVIDNDSWRLWPGGDKRLQVDKQFYRDLPIVTDEDLSTLKKKFSWVVDQLKKFVIPPKCRVVVIMGSKSDSAYCQRIQSHLNKMGVYCDLRVASAHKVTASVLSILAEYEGDFVPTVFIAVAGGSNGLGPVLAGNTVYPVINCPPVDEKSISLDIWSSIRLPSGLGCATVLGAEAAALHAVSILSLQDHYIWSRRRVDLLLNYITIMKSDIRMIRENEVNAETALREYPTGFGN